MIHQQSLEQLEKIKAYHTAKEIQQQPDTWLKTVQIVEDKKTQIEQFVAQVVSQPNYSIIFTGAGTSEFVGNSLVDLLRQKYFGHIESIATTAICTRPQVYFKEDHPTLLISFGRSGNSPESMGAIYSAETCCKQLYCLNITCNENGELAKYEGDGTSQHLAIVLPPETHDQSFAMTSSFTNMYLAAYLSLNLDRFETLKQETHAAAKHGKDFFLDQALEIKKLIKNFDFDRIVYLGSNHLKGIAQESGLKILELTAGDVASLYDTCLGFRHGPKSFVTNKTIIVLYTSSDDYAQKYEQDLFKELVGNQMAQVLSVTPKTYASNYETGHYTIVFDDQIATWILPLLNVLVAQLISLEKSVATNHTPDNPFPSGLVNRVVAGVTLYPYHKGE